MARLMTIRRAKEEIKRLEDYIELAESYEADTLEKLIIKEYAFSISIAEIVRIAERRGLLKNGKPIDRQDIISVIISNPKDKLHRLVKSDYLARTKHCRTNQYTW